MRVTNVHYEEQRIAFAEKAARHFEENPKSRTYTVDDIEPGELLAIRWGMGDDCVLVIRVGDTSRPFTGRSSVVARRQHERPIPRNVD